MKDSISLPNKAHKEYHPLGADATQKFNELIIPQAEIIQVQDTLIEYPCDRIQLKEHSFKEAEVHNQDNDPRLPAKNEKLLEIYKIFPPVIINLRSDAKSAHRDTRNQLTEAELNYFKKRNSSVIIFIHGFNLPYGDYSPQIVGISKSPVSLSTQSHLDSSSKLLLKSESRSTLYKSQSALEKAFNQGQAWPLRMDDEDLNGFGAHNWFVHMENNINVANACSDYRQYKRLIHIAWSGDVAPVNYFDAEEIADEAGKQLIPLMQQLNKQGIKIYGIAHSLGTRVLLSALQALSENKSYNTLEHVFLWQAAVTDSALSNDIQRDHSVKNNNHFPEAYLACKKMTVLYSKNDWVLHCSYFLANRIGLSPKQLLSPTESWESFYRFMDENPLEVLAVAKLAEGDIKSLLNASKSEKELDLLIRIVKESYRLTQAEQAMGYHGVDLKDPFMHELIQKGQLILVDQPQLSSHSAMKVPNSEMMEQVYKRWIINPNRGISDF